MPGPQKITLAEARAQGDFMLLFYCQNLAANCWHSGELRLDAAIARWGGALRLDQVPARCTQCGSRDHVDVRARPPKRDGGPAGPIIECLPASVRPYLVVPANFTTGKRSPIADNAS